MRINDNILYVINKRALVWYEATIEDFK